MPDNVPDSNPAAPGGDPIRELAEANVEEVLSDAERLTASLAGDLAADKSSSTGRAEPASSGNEAAGAADDRLAERAKEQQPPATGDDEIDAQLEDLESMLPSDAAPVEQAEGPESDAAGSSQATNEVELDQSAAAREQAGEERVEDESAEDIDAELAELDSLMRSQDQPPEQAPPGEASGTSAPPQSVSEDESSQPAVPEAQSDASQPQDQAPPDDGSDHAHDEVPLASRIDSPQAVKAGPATDEQEDEPDVENIDALIEQDIADKASAETEGWRRWATVAAEVTLIELSRLLDLADRPFRNVPIERKRIVGYAAFVTLGMAAVAFALGLLRG